MRRKFCSILPAAYVVCAVHVCHTLDLCPPAISKAGCN